MASPFRVFRKNQKLMLAFLGVLVMVGFVILPVWMQAMGVRRQANLRVASTTSYGDLQETDLRSLRWRRQAAIRLFQALGQQIIMAQGNPMAVSLVLRDLAPDEGSSPTSDEALVETWLLARRAEALGFLVDERAMQSFLNGLSQEPLSQQNWDRVLRAAGLNVQDLVGVLRDEVLALRLKRAFRVSLEGATPAQRWDYFQRMNRKVTIQSLPVPVSDSVDQVAEPDEATLQAFFDEHKDKLSSPTSPEPGFREPERIAVEYLKAEYERFFEREQKAVSPDEVKEYYEENRENYRQEKLPTFFDEEPAEGKSEPKAKEEEGPPSKPPTAEPKTSTPEPKTPTSEPKTSAGEPKATESANPEAAQDQGKQQAPQSTPPPATSDKQPDPGAQEPDAKEPAEGAASDAAGANQDTSALEMTSPFRLVAFASEGAEQPKASEPEPTADGAKESTAGTAPDDKAPSDSSDEKPAPDENPAPDEKPASDEMAESEEKPAPKQRPAAEASVPEKSAVEPPAKRPTAGSTPPEKPAAKASPAEKRPAIEAKAAKPSSPERTAEKEKPAAKAEPKSPEGAAATAEPEYLPLEKVEDEIRREIARDRANNKMEKLLNDLRNELSRYHDKLVRYEVDVDTKKEGETPKPPEKVDFAELAEEHGLTAHRTGLISALEAERLDIAKSTVGGQVSFLESAFELPEHRPQVCRDANGDRYLFWKLEEVEEKTPSLDDEGVRERVVRQWKMIEARSLTVEAAKRLAEEARASGKPLAEAFAERRGITVTESEPFQWLDHGEIPAWMAQGPPSLGEVEGVEAPGNEFMRAVFDLKKGQIGTAMNQPQTVVYVFQVIDSNPLPGVLWSTFVSETYWNYFRAADHDRSLAEEAWLDGIRSEVGFRWDPEYRRRAAQRRAD